MSYLLSLVYFEPFPNDVALKFANSSTKQIHLYSVTAITLKTN